MYVKIESKHTINVIFHCLHKSDGNVQNRLALKADDQSLQRESKESKALSFTYVTETINKGILIV